MAKTTVPQYLSATTSIIDSGDATTITIDGSENVAIGGGTNHDGAALLISHGDSGVTTFSDNADELVIENSSHAGISILTPNNASGSIIFGDSDDDDIGKIVFNHADNSLTLTATTVATSGNATVGGTLGVTGAVTANAGVVVDNITIDGTEIDLSSGDLTLDVAGDIILDADGGDFFFKDGGTEHGYISTGGNILGLTSSVSDDDIVFTVNDGGTATTALTIDGSAGGQLLAAPLGVSVPSYSFAGDSNTGMTRPTGDTLQFVTGGTERVRINSTGVVVGGDITKGSGEFKIKNTANGENVGIYTTSSSSEVHALKIHSGGNVEIKSGSLVAPGGATISKAGDGNTPVLHVTDSADTEVAWFEGNRAGDTGAFIAVRHNPSSQAESNRSGIKFQADDDGGNVTNYAKITQYIEDNTNTTEDARLGINVLSDGSDNEVVNIRKDQFIYKGDAGSSFIRVDNRADGHDTGFEIYQNGSRKWEIHSDDSNTDALDIRNNGGTQRFTFTQDGELGIGTTSPEELLHIRGATGDQTKIKLINPGSASTDDVQLTMVNTQYDWSLGINQSAGGHFQIARHETLGNYVNFTIHGNTGNVGIGSTTASTQLYVYNEGGGSSDCMTVQSGSTANSNVGMILFRDDDQDYCGQITTNGSTNTAIYNANTSDERLKENITDWDIDALALFKNIEPKEFNFKSQDEGAPKVRGYIAQTETSKFPEAFTTDASEEAYYSYNPGGMVIYLMKALKEQVAINEALEARITALEG